MSPLLKVTLRGLLGLSLLVGLTACPGGDGDDDNEGAMGQRGDDDDD